MWIFFKKTPLLLKLYSCYESWCVTLDEILYGWRGLQSEVLQSHKVLYRETWTFVFDDLLSMFRWRNELFSFPGSESGNGSSSTHLTVCWGLPYLFGNVVSRNRQDLAVVLSSTNNCVPVRMFEVTGWILNVINNNYYCGNSVVRFIQTLWDQSFKYFWYCVKLLKVFT